MNTKIAKFIIAVLALVVIFMAALVVKSVLVSNYVSMEPGDLALQEVSGTKTGLKFSDYGPILEKGLFAPPGRLSRLDSPSMDKADKIPAGDSLKSVTLVGTIVANPGHAVFINTKGNKKQKIFKVGERVFNVGELASVEKDLVTITQGGKIYTLHMPKGPLPRVSKGRSFKQRNRRNNPFDRFNQNPFVQPTSTLLAKKTGEREWVIEKRALEETLSDISKILNQARILPYKVKGETRGFRLSSIQPMGVFGLMGLRNGDILLKVNDYPINSPEKGMQLLSGLKGETSISLDILRAGKPTNLNYEIR